MGQFSYRGFDKNGKRAKGNLESPNATLAKEKIRELGILLSELKEVKEEAKKNIGKENLLIFTSQLSQLLSAKLPLFESLLALEEQARGEAYHPIILGLGERIKAGVSLSQAMNDFPHIFSPLYRALIAAGEAVGSLELSLLRLHNLLSQQRKISKQIFSALTYPMFLAVLMVVACSVLVTFVIPSVESLFEDQKIPSFTNIVFTTSRILRTYFPYIAAVIFSGFFITYVKIKRSKSSFVSYLISLPVIGRFILLTSLARFSRVLATLIEGGLTLTLALNYANEAIQHEKLKKIMNLISLKLIEGKTMSQELAKYKEIPPLFVRMVKIGEESGKLAPMLLQVSTLYEEETERILHKIVSLAQPVLLLIMGGVIGTVLLSILLPLSDFGSTIQL